METKHLHYFSNRRSSIVIIEYIFDQSFNEKWASLVGFINCFAYERYVIVKYELVEADNRL